MTNTSKQAPQYRNRPRSWPPYVRRLGRLPQQGNQEDIETFVHRADGRSAGPGYDGGVATVVDAHSFPTDRGARMLHRAGARIRHAILGASGNHKFRRPDLSQHQPLYSDLVLGMSSVAVGVEISEIMKILLPNCLARIMFPIVGANPSRRICKSPIRRRASSSERRKPWRTRGACPRFDPLRARGGDEVVHQSAASFVVSRMTKRLRSGGSIRGGARDGPEDGRILAGLCIVGLNLSRFRRG